MKIVNKIIRYINNKILRTPGLEFIQNNLDQIKRKKHIKFWINRAAKIKSFQKYFFEQNQSNKNNNSNIRFKNTSDFKISENMFDVLADNGVVVIEDALPKNEWISILDHFNDLKSKNEYENITINLISGSGGVFDVVFNNKLIFSNLKKGVLSKKYQ